MFEHSEFSAHEHVAMHYDASTGLRAIIAVHNTVRGPALGGCRIHPYANTQEALTDVLRLSRGMTYKSAIADLPLGGGKMVIIGDPKKIKTPELLRAAGRFVHSLNGLYITAEDVGMMSSDCRVIAEVTPYVSGIFSYSPHGGDPSPATAFGVQCAMQAAWEFHSGITSLAGTTCAIEGLGNVGLELARRLHRLGVTLYASDVDCAKLVRAKEYVRFTEVDTKELRKMDVDIYAPCALGGVINHKTIHEFKASIICGSANNILAEPLYAHLLNRQGIICVPDYVANCGGIIDVHYQRIGYDATQVEEHIRKIAYTMTSALLCRSKKESCNPTEIADEIARQRFQR